MSVYDTVEHTRVSERLRVHIETYAIDANNERDKANANISLSMRSSQRAYARAHENGCLAHTIEYVMLCNIDTKARRIFFKTTYISLSMRSSQRA
jgi:hypothetical protein